MNRAGAARSKKGEEAMRLYNIKNEWLRELNQVIEEIDAKTSAEELNGIYEYTVENRYSVLPPPEPEKNKYNPDGIYDILTVAEHPYFLGLTLTPWQRLTLKICYMGTPGNTHLKINDERDETGCEHCVWLQNKLKEENQIKAIKAHSPIIPKSYLPTENSPCLKCNRFDKEYIDIKRQYLISQAVTPQMEEDVIKKMDGEIRDRYYTERDMINYDLFPEDKPQVESKIGRAFQEIILVFGRRSGKSLMTSVISLYEVHRLIGMVHPQKRFGLMEFDIIRIINVANSASQAKEAIFDKTRPLVQSSPYFSKYVGKVPTQDEIFFLTPYDIKENERRLTSGIDPIPGTIQLRSGHSESSTMLGLTCFLIIIDEMAAMAKAGENSPDETLYNLLRPSIANFGSEGKMICISNALGPFGKFYELYEASFSNPNMLMLRLPTWIVNPTVEESFLEGERIHSPNIFALQYGSEFGSAGTSPWLDQDFIIEAFEAGRNRSRLERGMPGVSYFLHMDPAYSSDYYTLVIVHSEPTSEIGPDGKNLNKIFVDHIHYFAPQGAGKPVDIDDVDEYILKLAQRFRFASLTYDHYWGSMASVHKMKSYGLDARLITYGGGVKENIYAELQNLFISGRIEFYGIDTTVVKNGRAINLGEVTLAKKQFIGLQKKFKNNRFKIEAMVGMHDDIPDCVAGAAYEAIHYKTVGKLPKTVTAYTGAFLK